MTFKVECLIKLIYFIALNIQVWNFDCPKPINKDLQYEYTPKYFRGTIEQNLTLQVIWIFSYT